MWVDALLYEFEEQGLDPIELTRDLSGFANGKVIVDDHISLLSVRIVWHRAAALSRDSLLGVKVGMTTNQRRIGFLAPILWHSENISVALDNIMRYQCLISENGQYNRVGSAKQNYLQLIYEETVAAIESSVQQILSVVVGTMAAMKMLSRNKIVFTQMTVPELIHIEGLQSLLGIDEVCESDKVSFTIDKKSLSEPVLGRDTSLYSMCVEYAETLLNEKNKDKELTQKVQNYIVNNGVITADIGGCAKALDTYSRRIQRLLSSSGTSFSRLKDDVAKEITIKEMQNGKAIKEIAFTLGYSELSGFYRAFKSWFGTTPNKALRKGLF